MVSCPAEKQVGGNPGDIDRFRHSAVGECGFGEAGEDIVAGIAPAVFDIGREFLVEEDQRPVRDLAVRSADHGAATLLFHPNEVIAELHPVLGRHAQQVGDDEHRKGLGEGVHELARTLGNEGVRSARRPAST